MNDSSSRSGDRSHQAAMRPRRETQMNAKAQTVRYCIFVRRSHRNLFRARPDRDEIMSIIRISNGGYTTEEDARRALTLFSADVRPMLDVSEFIWAGAFDETRPQPGSDDSGTRQEPGAPA